MKEKKLCFNEKKLGEIGAKKLSLLTQQSKGKTLWKTFSIFLIDFSASDIFLIKKIRDTLQQKPIDERRKNLLNRFIYNHLKIFIFLSCEYKHFY